MFVEAGAILLKLYTYAWVFPMSHYWFTPDQSLSLHAYQYRASDLCLPHKHAEYAIFFCLDGTMEIASEHGPELMQGGDLILINPGESHYFGHEIGGSTSKGVCLLLARSAVEKSFEEMHIRFDTKRESLTFLSQKIHDPVAKQLVQGLLDEFRERKQGHEIILRCGVLQLFVYLLRHHLKPTIVETSTALSSQLPYWQMAKANEYMNQCGKSSFSLSGICSMIGSSPSRFIRLWKNSTSLEPHTYYNRILIEKARMLLRAGHSSVKEIADQLGFHNASHFCTFFRSLSGTTPTGYQMLQAARAAQDWHPRRGPMTDPFQSPGSR
jgi:AraC-like DNA-binding protein